MIFKLLEIIAKTLGFSAAEREAHRVSLKSTASVVPLSASAKLAGMVDNLVGADAEWMPVAVLTWADATAVMTPSGCFAVDTLLANLKAEVESIRDSYDGDTKMGDDDQARVVALRRAANRVRDVAAKRNWVHPDLRNPTKGSVPAARLIAKYDFVMSCGVHLLIGKGASGKSYLAHELGGMDADGEQTNSYGLLRVGEPLSGYDHEPATNAVNLLSAMFAFDVIVLDSVKDLLSMGGAAMKSGISRGAVATFSPWSSMACDLGACVIAIVNISTTDDEAVEAIIEAARSNATGVIAHTGDSKWKYFVRSGEGLFRRTGSIHIVEGSPGNASKVVLKPEEDKLQLTSGRPDMDQTVTVTYSALTEAVRRALSGPR